MKLLERYSDNILEGGFLIFDDVFDDLEKMKKIVMDLNKTDRLYMQDNDLGRTRIGLRIPEFAKYADYTCDKVNSFIEQKLRASHGQCLFQYCPGSMLDMHTDSVAQLPILNFSTVLYGESKFRIEVDGKEFKRTLKPNQAILFSPRNCRHGKEASPEFSCTHLYYFLDKDHPYKLLREEL